jgi:hypothetical protein
MFSHGDAVLARNVADERLHIPHQHAEIFGITALAGTAAVAPRIPGKQGEIGKSSLSTTSCQRPECSWPRWNRITARWCFVRATRLGRTVRRHPNCESYARGLVDGGSSDGSMWILRLLLSLIKIRASRKMCLSPCCNEAMPRVIK